MPSTHSGIFYRLIYTIRTFSTISFEDNPSNFILHKGFTLILIKTLVRKVTCITPKSQMKVRFGGLHNDCRNDMAKRWNISARLIRRYCIVERINGTVYIGNAWMIPENEKITALSVKRRPHCQRALDPKWTPNTITLIRWSWHRSWTSTCALSISTPFQIAMLMFKECLRHEITPFILDDKRQTEYLKCIREWDMDRTTIFRSISSLPSPYWPA